MRCHLVLLVLVSPFGAFGCAHVYTRRELGQVVALAADPACTYNHVQAGTDWPALDKKCNYTCSGNSQSPVNLPGTFAARLKPDLKANLNFGVASKLRVLNVGHAVQVEFDSPTGNQASVPVFDGSVYGIYRAADPNAVTVVRTSLEPLQFHMHSTSEHLLKSNSGQIELHLVTKLTNATGPLPKECPQDSGKNCLAVFGVLYDVDPSPTAKGDPTIQKIINNLPTGCTEAGRDCRKDFKGTLDLKSLLPDAKYSTYTGSLTTPPCSEGVMWHVFSTIKKTLTQAQVVHLQLALSTAKEGTAQVENRLNNRLTMPLHQHKVYSSP